MNNGEISLASLPPERKAKVVRIGGGFGLQNKLRVMGIREGQVIRIVSKQFFRGPITVVVNGCQVTLGRGMAQRIIVEVM
ncbi:FeoA family protein [[Eubacterium] cellulosolvens]